MRDQEIIGLYEAYQQVHSQLQEVEQLDEEAPERIRKPSNRNKSRKMLPGYPARLHNPKPTKMDEEAVENWVNSLIEEGYDLSDYTWDDMCKMYMSEERRDPDFDKMERQEYRHTSKAVKQSGGSRGSSKNRSFKMSSIRGALKRGEDPRADGYGGARAARGNPPEDHRASFSKNPLNNPPRRVKKAGVQKESFDLFDTILEHLVAEGYADTNESALVIMANMSEEWRQSIVEDNSTGKTMTVGGQTFRDYNSDGLSDRQKRMKEFGEKRLRDSLKGV